MSTTTAASRTPYVHWLTESRPPSLTWGRPSLPESNQPLLDLVDHEQDGAEAAASQDRGVRLTTVRARWSARPRPGLPDPQQWSARLALTVIQTLLGQRPVAQTTRSKHDLAILACNSVAVVHVWLPVRGQSCLRLSAGGATNMDIIEENLQRRRLRCLLTRLSPA
jgi:hypothetical protein